MKPNGKYFAVRVVFLGLCAVGLLSAVGQAETARGTFKLPVETHWGMMVLAPGEYDFSVSDGISGGIVTVRSKESRSSGMVLPASWSETKSASGATLMLKKSEGSTYVQSLRLGDSGVVLYYGMPTSGKEIRLVKQSPKPAVMAAASGGQ